MSFTTTTLLRRDPADYANCTLSTCDISTSFWYYQPSFDVNALFLGLFTVSLLWFLITYIRTRRFTAFTLALSAGTLLEILGYVGRVIAHYDLWSDLGFLLQIICLTIAPAFIAGGVYMCFRRMVYAFGREASRISPEAYTRIFITCDFISLVLQAMGGGMASTAAQEGKPSATGDKIMVAGLAFQVFTLAVFMGLCIDFIIRATRGSGDQSFVQSRTETRFRGFLASLAIATICIFIRSIYRVIELAQGWQGQLIRKQWLFVGFEGVMVVIAVLVLNFFHPAWCFRESTVGGMQFRFWPGKSRTTTEEEGAEQKV